MRAGEAPHPLDGQEPPVMLPVPVSADEIIKLAAAYGVTVKAEQLPAIALLAEKAQELFPATVEARLVSGKLSGATVASIVQDMVVRVLRNIRGLRQVSIDDFSGTIDQAISSGQLYLSPDERSRLVGRSRARVGSIRLAIPPHRVP